MEYNEECLEMTAPPILAMQAISSCSCREDATSSGIAAQPGARGLSSVRPSSAPGIAFGKHSCYHPYRFAGKRGERYAL
jgi:hypothetical protein